MRLEAGYDERILVFAEESVKCCPSIQREALISYAQRTRCKKFLHGTSIAVQTSTSADSSCRLNTVIPSLSINPTLLASGLC